MKRTAITIIRISDKKAGHDQQSLGLSKALMSILALKSTALIEIAPFKKLTAVGMCLRLNVDIDLKIALGINQLEQKNTRYIVIGAGHGTHLSVLALKYYFKAIAIILMKPSLPRFLFDYCIIARHDGVKASTNALISDGALNTLDLPVDLIKKNQHIILIGGLSTHFDWDTKIIIENICTWIMQQPLDMKIILTNSRRTPENLNAQLWDNLTKITQQVQVTDHYAKTRIDTDHFEWFDHQNTPQGWLADQLLHSQAALITEDSVSMIYEALTADVRLSLIRLSPIKRDKIAKNNQYLAACGYLDYFDYFAVKHNAKKDIKKEINLPRLHKPLNESFRIAAKIKQQLIQKGFL
ncbi:nucleoside-diphosphate sugar epimerase [Gammaproteobacteria bacterium]|nr:nucleoside-diphosphate sugar epimerase [Gammaproteobacteria bacterium]